MTVTNSEHKPAPSTTQRQGTPMPPDQLGILFGKSLPHQEPVHLLGAGLCLLNASCDYSADLNPYPPKSPHHAGVETGWRMARAAITGDVAELPGVL